MNCSIEAAIQELSRPLEPIATHVEPVLPQLPGIRAVMLDVYGTLFVSGSGDIGTTAEELRADAAAGAFDQMGLELSCPAEEAAATYVNVIEDLHAEARRDGIDYPEVDVREVWQSVLERLEQEGKLAFSGSQVDIPALAIAFECRTNPVWPMPGLAACLAALRENEVRLGIISNAQFFTPHLFPALAGGTVDALGFDPQLRYYSYEHRQAKPSETMYRAAAAALEKLGIGPHEMLYVGNDMLNDILPASGVGFRTALFAGDQRSLRFREGHPEASRIQPDAVVTELAQLPKIVLPPTAS